jgi:hypothetical protein
MQHDWVPSTLGHGETMCSRCFVTNREAAVLGIMNTCDAPAPKAANENWPQDRIDDEMEQYAEDDGSEPGDECGRWTNGRLGRHCSKAGSEECEFECPYRTTDAVRC